MLVCFADEVRKDPISQFGDKLPELSKQDGWETMGLQLALSEAVAHKSVHIACNSEFTLVFTVSSRCCLTGGTLMIAK